MEWFKGNEMLNQWFVGILWLKIVFSSFALIGAIIGQIETDPNWWFLIDVVLMLCAISGAYLLTTASKIGFYLVVGSNFIVALVSFVRYINFDSSEYGMFAGMAAQQILKGVWSGLGQIVSCCY